MKLYLASSGLPTNEAHLARLHEMVGADKRLLFIDNAKDLSSASERAAHTDEKRVEFTKAGFDFFELDLRDYFGSPDSLKPLVEAAPFVWVSGGNTFVLRRAFAYSGFDTLLQNALKSTNMVYGGSSAGSIIMTKTLRGTEHGDDPYQISDAYKEDILWDGLGLVYPQLIPHYGSEWFGEKARAMEDYFKQAGLKYETLRDGEAYVVDGEYEQKLV